MVARDSEEFVIFFAHKLPAIQSFVEVCLPTNCFSSASSNLKDKIQNPIPKRSLLLSFYLARHGNGGQKQRKVLAQLYSGDVVTDTSRCLHRCHVDQHVHRLISNVLHTSKQICPMLHNVHYGQLWSELYFFSFSHFYRLQLCPHLVQIKSACKCQIHAIQKMKSQFVETRCFRAHVKLL